MFSDSENMTRYARRPGEYEAVVEDLGAQSFPVIRETVVRVFGFKEYYTGVKHTGVILNWRTDSVHGGYDSYNLYTDDIRESPLTDMVSFYFKFSRYHEFCSADKSRMKLVRAEINAIGELVLSISE